MTSDREAYEADWYAAMRRAVELIEDHPFLEPETIITALDDEFAGSMILPSGDTALTKAVYTAHRETTRLAFSDLVKDVHLNL